VASTIHLSLLEQEEVCIKAFQKLDKVGRLQGESRLPRVAPLPTRACRLVSCATSGQGTGRPPALLLQDGSGTLTADEVAEAVGMAGRMSGEGSPALRAAPLVGSMLLCGIWAAPVALFSGAPLACLAAALPAVPAQHSLCPWSPPPMTRRG
jgi:hypothetical protein